MIKQAPVIWNPYSNGYFENPYPHLKLCRQTNPIQTGIVNSWMFFRYAEVNKFLRSNDFLAFDSSQYYLENEPAIFKNSSQCPFLAKSTKQWPMFLNGEYHKKIRAIIGKALNEYDVEKIIDDAVQTTNDLYKSQPSFDLVKYSSQFIYLVIKKILGIAESVDLESVVKYSNMIAIGQDIYVPRQVFQEVNAQLLWGRDIFPDSEFKALIKDFMDKSNIEYTEDDIYSILCISTMASFETSKDNLVNALVEIVKDESLMDYIINSNKEELDMMVEETLRYSTPLQFVFRINKNPLEIDGISIPANSKLFLSLASANRDEAVFENADVIIPNRNPNNHLAFSGGVHYCLGAGIARLELRRCLKPMAQLLKEYKIAGGEIQKVKWGKQTFMRTMGPLILERAV